MLVQQHNVKEMTAVLSVVKPKNITHAVAENLPNRNLLKDRYGLSPRSFYLWHTFLNIEPPARGGYFTIADLILLDEFWIAQRVFRFSQEKFKDAVVLTLDGSFEKLVAEYTEIPLADYLKKSSQFNKHPVVLDTIARLEANSQ